jgi:hypothetical protein
MRWRDLLFLWSIWSCAATAQPEFSGPRADDAPVPPLFLATVGEKNLDVGLPDISQAQGWNTIEIRIYAGFGEAIAREDGVGHPLTLYRLRVRGGALSEAWIYPYCSSQGQLALADLSEAWRSVVAERFFDIPDDKAIAGYNHGVRDGEGYLVQIASYDQLRTFMLTNPAAGGNADLPESQRLLRVIAAVKALFPTLMFCDFPA